MKAGLALGANLGDRLAQLSEAARLLRERCGDGEHFLASRIHETDPVDCPPDSPPFYNAAVEIDTPLPAAELHRRCQEIEEQLGRERSSERNAPRFIDIDLLYYGEETIGTPDLVVPHPRMREREFVMRPLAEIRPDLVTGLPDRDQDECSCRPAAEQWAFTTD